MADIIYITKEGLVKLNDELKELKENKRVEIAKKLKEAIEFGDLSENAEYEEARNEQAQVEVRILELEKQLKNIKIIEEDKKGKSDRVNIGSLVEIENSKDKSKTTYKIVGTTESDILADTPKISNESPVGNAILGKKKGDSVKVKTPAGSSEFKIISIK